MDIRVDASTISRKTYVVGVQLIKHLRAIIVGKFTKYHGDILAARGSKYSLRSLGFLKYSKGLLRAYLEHYGWAYNQCT